MSNNVYTTFMGQSATAGSVSGSIFIDTVFDDSVISDDVRLWVDDPSGTGITT